MTSTTVSVFESTIHKTNGWLNDIMSELDWDDHQKAYRAMRAVLHTLRDRLSVHETADLSAQLPMLVRGIFFEGWNPAGQPNKERKATEFMGHVAEQFSGDSTVDAEKTTRAVFRVLARHVSAGEIENVQHCLPKELRELWD